MTVAWVYYMPMVMGCGLCNFGSVASVKKILFYANDCEPFKNNFIENQGFMILDCPGFD